MSNKGHVKDPKCAFQVSWLMSVWVVMVIAKGWRSEKKKKIREYIVTLGPIKPLWTFAAWKLSQEVALSVMYLAGYHKVSKFSSWWYKLVLFLCSHFFRILNFMAKWSRSTLDIVTLRFKPLKFVYLLYWSAPLSFSSC